MEDRVIIDLRRKDEPTKELEADLIIEIERIPDGYIATYNYRDGERYVPYNYFTFALREEMVKKHAQVIRDVKPKTVVVRTGRPGATRDVAIHPGVVKMILEGKLTADELMLRG